MRSSHTLDLEERTPPPVSSEYSIFACTVSVYDHHNGDDIAQNSIMINEIDINFLILFLQYNFNNTIIAITIAMIADLEPARIHEITDMAEKHIINMFFKLFPLEYKYLWIKKIETIPAIGLICIEWIVMPPYKLPLSVIINVGAILYIKNEMIVIKVIPYKTYCIHKSFIENILNESNTGPIDITMSTNPIRRNPALNFGSTLLSNNDRKHITINKIIE